MGTRVIIAGGGPAPCAAVLALRRRGVAVRLSLGADDRISLPLVLNEAAVGLLVDLSGGSAWLDQAHQLRRRVVRWGKEPARTVLEPAVSLPGAMLRERLLDIALRQLDAHDLLDDGADAAKWMRGDENWLLYGDAGGAPSETQVERFGRRVMLSAEVALVRRAEPDICWMEGNANGWVFLAPVADGRAIVQASLPEPPSGCPAGALVASIASTRHIFRLVEALAGKVHVHCTAPALRRPLGGSRWLAIGNAAMSLDPVCGDGTAQALRSGLLAAAIIATSQEGSDPRALIEHYDRRVARTFAAHLAACARLYDPAVFGAGWEREIAVLRQGADALAGASRAPLEFSLNEGWLVPIEPSA